ncbi:TetR family transcriptional regulator [Vallitalea longa]|uniref:TetR family transcriptional regulator n=1 Tax=Vallitalea longa TaxID=2936439 RepID=A0A9W5YDM5_9FIRM|nr:TetR/AcrR family transcriptional regulator [Vallitalea longa]GKX29994.1 TetR family transcriptional regulator [Vallitalea longa]
MNIENISRRERKKIKTKSNILTAARHLFEEKGYENVLIEDITERSDVSKGTFFNYFTNKEGLMLAVAEDEVFDILELADENFYKIESSKKKIKMIMERLLKDSIPYMQLTGRMVFSTIINSGDSNSPFHKIYELLDSLVDEGKENLEFTKDVTNKVIVNSIIGAYYSLIFRWFDSKEKVTIDDVSSILDIIYKGLSVQ